MLEFEKAEKIRELADKERERVQATDKLKNGKDSLIEICCTKSKKPKLICFPSRKSSSQRQLA
jgi:hypothetical protein